MPPSRSISEAPVSNRAFAWASRRFIVSSISVLVIASCPLAGFHRLARRAGPVRENLPFCRPRGRPMTTTHFCGPPLVINVLETCFAQALAGSGFGEPLGPARETKIGGAELRERGGQEMVVWGVH